MKTKTICLRLPWSCFQPPSRHRPPLPGTKSPNAWSPTASTWTTSYLPGPRKFTRIKVCVYENPVHFYDFDIFFRNGGHQDVSVRARLNPGECTRNIDLNGGLRNINRIKFKYEETSWFIGRAVVRVFGE